jgi:cytochrome c
MNKKLRTAIAGISVAVMSLGGSLAAMAAATDGVALYFKYTCYTCHGNDAKTPLLPMYPKLAGQNKEYIIAQMKDIKSGKRNNGNSATMKGIMYGVTEQEIETIAEWLASLEPKTAPLQAASENLEPKNEPSQDAASEKRVF